MSDTVIKVDNVTKKFVLPHQRVSSLKSYIMNPFKRTEKETQLAINDISFKVKKGEFFGVVGRNGSGKSTLLKCLAGVYAPDGGNIEIDGTLVPFIELGVGFNPELSGRDNVFLNGALLGFSRDEIKEMYDEIVEFSELGQFMDQKLKNYSSGMQVRLAFSIAIQAKGDILLLDEVLAVGDSAFQKKCYDYFYQLKDSGTTVVLVSHNMTAIEQFCDRAIIIDNGKLIGNSKPEEIADLYNEQNLKTSEKRIAKNNEKSVESSYELSDLPAQITSVKTVDPGNNKAKNTFLKKEKIGVEFTIKAHKDIESPTVGLVFKDEKDRQVFATNTPTLDITLKDMKEDDEITVLFDIENIFGNSTYYVSGAVANKGRSLTYHRVRRIHQFEVGGWKMNNSIAHPQHTVSVNYP